ncbi:Uncharacterised protein [Chryseobacterium taklimakanense]|uniref:Uncharacterized protein n=1 Tax=Chryseobacterium taklimakanense TaxID=536441 RepID=A0A239XPL9_9FLAO|nr:hypothetical protein [Chryseobacterium taklimakanense]SNV48176.1 Uncharacterised protein [Chryseobacterium taklimakanense]
METRKQKLQQIIGSKDEYFFMYADDRMMFFRNRIEIPEVDYRQEVRSGTKVEMPLFFDQEVKKQFNLKTFEDEQE